MNTRNLLMTAAIFAAILAAGGEAWARGGGGRGGFAGGAGLQSPARVQGQWRNGIGTATQMRPADSRRRDGTFLQTGTTANGATDRPGHGRGVMDGSAATSPVVGE